MEDAEEQEPRALEELVQIVRLAVGPPVRAVADQDLQRPASVAVEPDMNAAPNLHVAMAMLPASAAITTFLLSGALIGPREERSRS